MNKLIIILLALVAILWYIGDIHVETPMGALDVKAQEWDVPLVRITVGGMDYVIMGGD